VEYDIYPLKEGEPTDDYMEGEYGELVPMYNTTTQLQYSPLGRMAIKCFGYGCHHKKVEFPNNMILGAFIPLCGYCGLAHPIDECSLTTSIAQVPTTLIIMIGIVDTFPLKGKKEYSSATCNLSSSSNPSSGNTPNSMVRKRS